MSPEQTAHLAALARAALQRFINRTAAQHLRRMREKWGHTA